MAELYPLLLQYRTMVYPNTMLSVSRNVVGSQSESSITSAKSPESCRLGCGFLCSMIGHSESTQESQQSNRIAYTPEQCTKIGYFSAMYYCMVWV